MNVAQLVKGLDRIRKPQVPSHYLINRTGWYILVNLRWRQDDQKPKVTLTTEFLLVHQKCTYNL